MNFSHHAPNAEVAEGGREDAEAATMLAKKKI
jgi:hypothetical protein